MSTPSTGRRGTELMQIVREFTALGFHRTGSAVDRATSAWFVKQLEERGFEVNAETLVFDQWVGEGQLTAGGRSIDHLALQTPWVGEINSSNPMVVKVDPMSGGFAHVVDEPIRAAISTGADALVIATDHPNGTLVGINREPEKSDTPAFPVMLVAGRDFEQCFAGPTRMELRARVEAGHTTNIAANRGGPGRPVMLTTPLNGWFGCAGERGTGIAVLLDLIDRLPDRALIVVATGGHELGFFGARRHVDAGGSALEAVVHIGASVAVEQDDPEVGRRLASTRVAMTTLDETTGARVATALQRANLSLVFEASRWIGEANEWSRLRVPLLSVSGAGIDFHTPDDTPDRVTSPAALELASDALAEATLAFLDAISDR